jgi:hypothetical protein
MPMRRGGREVMHVARGTTTTHQHLRDRLIVIVVATVVLDTLASVLAYYAERHEPGTGITNIGDAVFWATTQLLTVSSQLPNPLTTEGRVVDVVLQIWAISVVAALAGSFGSFFQRRSAERDEADALSGG